MTTATGSSYRWLKCQECGSLVSLTKSNEGLFCTACRAPEPAPLPEYYDAPLNMQLNLSVDGQIMELERMHSLCQ